MARDKNTAKEIRQMVRLIDSDVDGNRQICMALQEVRGVGFNMAVAICNALKLDRSAKIGNLSDNEVKKIEEVIREPLKHGIPAWMLNRRKDYETGDDKHIITSDLKLSVEDDIKRLKKIKAYKGMRHAVGLPVRGQRTKGHFRKGAALGVARSKKKKSGK